MCSNSLSYNHSPKKLTYIYFSLGTMIYNFINNKISCGDTIFQHYTGLRISSQGHLPLAICCPHVMVPNMWEILFISAPLLLTTFNMILFSSIYEAENCMIFISYRRVVFHYICVPQLFHPAIYYWPQDVFNFGVLLDPFIHSWTFGLSSKQF